FQQALQRDPRFAMAHVGIAGAHLQLVFTESVPPSEIVRQARAAAEKALDLDPGLAQAHTILGVIAARFEWQWAQAEQRLRRAMELNPRAPEPHQSYSVEVLLPNRRFDDAMAHCRQARELDPGNTQVAFCTGWILMRQNPAAAVTEYEHLL